MQKHSPLTSTDFDGANQDIQGVRDKNPPKCPRKNPLEVIFRFIMAIIGISLEYFVKSVTGFFRGDPVLVRCCHLRVLHPMPAIKKNLRNFRRNGVAR